MTEEMRAKLDAARIVVEQSEGEERRIKEAWLRQIEWLVAKADSLQGAGD